MRIKKTMIALTVFLTSILNAQTTIEKPFIEVIGKSEMTVMPDQIIVSIVLKEREKGKKIKSTNEQLEVLKNELKRLNIPLHQLSLKHSNSDYIRVRFRKTDLVNKVNYHLILKNAKEVNEVFTMLDEIDVFKANITNVTHSKAVEFKKEMRISAIKSARDKADYLLKELNAERGLPLIVREENSTPFYHSNNLSANSISYGSPKISNYSKSYNEGKVGFRKIKITAQVYVKFLIKEKKSKVL